MSSISVLESLKELFPQVDNRILKATSIEHANNLDAAIEFILLEVTPHIPENSSKEMDGSSTSNNLRASVNSNGGVLNLNEFDEEEAQSLYDSIVNSSTPLIRNNSKSKIISQSSGSSFSSSESKNWDLNVLVANNKLASENDPNGSNGLNGSDEFPSFESEVITRSSHSVNMELLEDFVNDAKNSKVNMVGSVEMLSKMLREVMEMEEKAENAKTDGLSAGQETLLKVEELRQMLVRAKQANDMHSGEVYGERSILSTEARELQSRLVTLSDERNKSLQLIEQIRVVLDGRLKTAQEEISKAENDKILKENSAKEALKEQEDLMNVIVEESKKLKLEAEENSKLGEFLVDRSHLVDALQGEISVICEDITKLKEIVDGNIPMSKSFLSTMSSLSSSSFSLHKSTASNLSERETTQLETTSGVPNGGERSSPSCSSDGWELFENDEEIEN